MEIYAEISESKLRSLEEQLKEISGISFERRWGSVGSSSCYFEFDSDESKESLIDFLERHRILWQEEGE